MNEAVLHLKVCESCGRLWLRGTGTVNVYCKNCHAQLEQFPAPRGRRSPVKSHRASRKCTQSYEKSGGQL